MQTCLVIDESSVVRKVAARILSRCDVAFEDAADGAEGLRKIAAKAPDVLLISASLLDMPADEFVRAVRAMPGCAGITILPLLVEANLGRMTRLKRAGASGFVFKPFDRASLTRWLEPYLDISIKQAA